MCAFLSSNAHLRCDRQCTLVQDMDQPLDLFQLKSVTILAKRYTGVMIRLITQETQNFDLRRRYNQCPHLVCFSRFAIKSVCRVPTSCPGVRAYLLGLPSLISSTSPKYLHLNCVAYPKTVRGPLVLARSRGIIFVSWPYRFQSYLREP